MCGQCSEKIFQCVHNRHSIDGEKKEVEVVWERRRENMPEEKKSKSGEGERVSGCLGQSSNNNYKKKVVWVEAQMNLHYFLYV